MEIDDFGCVNSDISVSTYMTRTIYENDKVWNVEYHETVESNSSNNGIRPVIEISKKVFEKENN